MRSRVDLRIEAKAVESLVPPPRSLVDGGTDGVVVTTRCLRPGSGVSRREVTLFVDRVTARRFDRTCRWESWRLRARPFVLAVAASGLLALIVNVVGFPSYEPPPALLPALAVLVNALVVANLLPAALRSRHHPRLVGYVVLLRGVDREAAQSWAALYPRGTIEIVD